MSGYGKHTYFMALPNDGFLSLLLILDYQSIFRLRGVLVHPMLEDIFRHLGNAMLLILPLTLRGSPEPYTLRKP